MYDQKEVEVHRENETFNDFIVDQRMYECVCNNMQRSKLTLRNENDMIFIPPFHVVKDNGR